MPIEPKPQEEEFLDLLIELNIPFIQNVGRLDFFLPSPGIYVELKQFPCDRLQAQLESAMPQPVLVLCGPHAVAAFREFLMNVRNSG